MPGFIANFFSHFSCHLIRFWTWTKTNILLVFADIRYNFFDNFHNSISICLFYLLCRLTQISCAGWAILLVFSKHSFKFSTESWAQSISRWSKIVEYISWQNLIRQKSIKHCTYFLEQISKKLLPSLSYTILITWRIN